MNFKKLKRLLSVMLSASMILSSNLTVLATETAELQQVESVAEQGSHEHDWQLETVMKDATADEAGWGTYVCECGETQSGVINPVASAEADGEDGTPTDTEQTTETQPTETPSEKKAVEVNGTGYDTLTEALAQFEAAGGASEAVTVTLNENVTLDGIHAYNLANVTVHTNGHMIAVSAGSKIKLAGGTFSNDQMAVRAANGFTDATGNHVMLAVQSGAKLTIDSGTYQTKAVQLLSVYGDAVINGGTFACNLDKTIPEEAAHLAAQNNYDGATLLDVDGENARLTINGGTINADVGNDAYDGMYGIYALNGGTLIMNGTETVKPEVHGKLAAIGMNTLHKPVYVTINDGVYTSSVKGADGNQERFNTVLYFSAECTVTINGGTFTAASGERTHALSHVSSQTQNITINGGTFKSTASAIFKYGAESNSQVTVKGGTFSSDPETYLPTGYETTPNADSTEWSVAAACNHAQLDANLASNWVPQTDATCTAAGTNAHYKCPNCSRKFSHKTAAGWQEISDEQLTIEKLNHDAVLVPENTVATCKEKVHSEYYICINCERAYADFESFKNDTDGSTSQAADDFTTGDFGAHTYGENAYSFDWGTFASVTEAETPDELAELDKDVCPAEDGTTSVTANRTCSVCNEAENAASVTVQKTADSASYVCTTGQTVTYTATASFGQEEPPAPETPAPAAVETETDTHTVTIPAKTAHTWEYTVTAGESVDFDNLNVSMLNRDLTAADGITVTRTCTACAAFQAETAEKARLETASPVSATCEKQPLAVTVKAQFAGETAFGEIESKDITVAAGNHSIDYVPYQAPTCADEGHIAHYYCSTCEKHFDSPLANNEISDVTIEALSHNFNLPRFAWEGSGPAATTAKATFTCMKCGAEVTRGSLAVAEEGTLEGTIVCGQKATYNHAVTVLFDKAAVTKTDRTDAYGDPIYEYDTTKETQEGTREITGSVPKTALVIHNFKQIELNWTEMIANDAYHNLGNGMSMTAVLTCDNCKKTVTIKGTKAVADDGTESINSTIVTSTDSITGATGTLTWALDEDDAEYSEAYCTSDGTNVYTATITCDAQDSSGTHTYTETTTTDPITSAATTKPLRFTAKTAATRHSYKVVGSNDIGWEGKPGNSNVYARLTCTNAPEKLPHSVTLIGADEGVTTTEITSSDTVDYEASKAKEPSCTNDGLKTWKVSVEYLNKIITQYNHEGVDAPGILNTASETDGTESETPPTGTLYVSMDIPKLGGHQYDNGKWDWTPYQNGVTDAAGNKIAYYVYTCTSKACDGEPDETTETNPDIVYGFVTNQDETKSTTKKLVAEVTETITTQPTCTKEGAGSATAHVRLADSGIADATYTTGSIPPKGHTWGTISWDMEDQIVVSTTETVSFGNFQVPVITVNAARTCTAEGCDASPSPAQDKAAGTAGADTPNPNENGSYIEITVESHTPATCEAAGSTTYLATFYNVKSAGETPQSCGTHKYTVPHAPINHAYANTVEVDWTTKTEKTITIGGKELGTGEFTVEAKRICSHDETHEEIVPVIVTVTGNCAPATADATEGTLTFTAAIDWENYEPSDNATTETLSFSKEEGKTNTKTETYAKHSVSRISGNSNTTDCNEPIYESHYHCSQCGKNFRNSDAITEIEISYEAPGHQYGQPRFEWTVEGQSADAVFTCTRCNASQVTYSASMGNPYVEPGKESTCLKSGTAYYSVYKEFDANALPAGITAARYDGELEGSLPLADHKFEPDPNQDNASACIWCKKLENNLVTVTYSTSTGVTIESGSYLRDGSDLPLITAPNQNAYTFLYWTVNGTQVTVNSPAELKAEVSKVMAAATEAVTVVAQYEPIKSSATVQVVYVNAGDKAAATIENVGVGTNQSVTADAVEGKKFSHWSSDEEGTIILGRETTYEVYILASDAGKTKTIYAIYVNDDAEVGDITPTIAMTDKFASEVDGVNKISFTATMSIPEGYEMVDSGILYGTKADVFTGEGCEDRVVVNSGNSAIRTSVLNGKKTNTLSIKVGTNTTATVYARGYLRYINTKTQETKVIYTIIDQDTFENLKNSAQ